MDIILSNCLAGNEVSSKMKVPVQAAIWPVAVYGALVVALLAVIIGLSYVIGERHHAPAKDIPYESGIEPTGSARMRYGARYYLVGIFFLLFDVEAAVIFAWAVAFYELGWPGYIAAALFIITLVAGLVYLWKLGGLDWYSSGNAARGESQGESTQ